jgi:hypothetical protein
MVTNPEVATERGARISKLDLMATLPMLCFASLVCLAISDVCRGFSRTRLGKAEVSSLSPDASKSCNVVESPRPSEHHL